jgi:PAS domain S-box-containing protein
MENGSEKKQVPFVLLNPTERLINKKKAELKARFGKENIDGLIHELQVSRVELELHNAELERSRKKSERLKNKYQSLFEFSPVGYLIFDHEGFITDVNESCCKMLGMEKEFLVSRMFQFFIVPQEREIFNQFFINTLCEEDKQTCEIKVRNRHGEIFYSKLEGLKFEDEVSELPQLRIAMIDITEIKRTEESLRKNSSELLFYKKFLEEKTLDLASVFISLAKSEKALRSAQFESKKLREEFSAEIKNSLHHILNSTADELWEEKFSLSKELAGKVKEFLQKQEEKRIPEPDTSRIKLSALIREIISLIKTKEKGIKIASELNKEVLVSGQEGMLKFLLKNIFTNVIGAAPSTEELSVKVLENNSTVEICFTGSLKQINTKAPDIGSKFSKGAKNISLRLCRDLIESVGGSMTFKEKSGKTDFKFLLPKQLPPIQPDDDGKGSKIRLSAA